MRYSLLAVLLTASLKRVLVALTAILMMSSVATATQTGSGDISSIGPNTVILHWTANDDPGGGLTRYDVFLDDPANNNISYALVAMTFSGTINQNAAFGTVTVNDEVNAANYNLSFGSGYSKATDSYFFTPFTANLFGAGITDSGPISGLAARSYAITGSSGNGSMLDVVQIAQIVASGDVGVSGEIGRNGLSSFAQGTMTPIPEPSTLALLGIAGIIAATRRASDR